MSDRKLWGIVLRSKALGKVEYTGPLFTGWFVGNPIDRKGYLGEPSRALLFVTRDHARAFCDTKNATCRDLKWHFFPVRVREEITELPR